MAAGSGSAPASGSESPPARREGLLPRRESLWLGEGWTETKETPPLEKGELGGFSKVLRRRHPQRDCGELRKNPCKKNISLFEFIICQGQS